MKAFVRSIPYLEFAFDFCLSTITHLQEMNPIEIVYQNFPHSLKHSDHSFLGVLHEESRLDMDAYWQLEWALVSLTDERVNYSKYLIWPGFRIFSYAMVLLKANVQQNDLYSIANLSESQEGDFAERVRLVFEGFFQGKAPNLTSGFDERNPLMS